MTLEHVTCARLPASDLGSLAGLRRLEGIAVILEGDHAWVFWEPGNDRVLRALLPVDGVELFEKQGDGWHRPGRRLPSFDVPSGSEGMALARVVTPEPFRAELPDEQQASRPVELCLVRDHRPRPTTAALCSMADLGRWADSATSAEIEAIRGAFRGESALLLGDALPPWPGSTRYWGRRVLIPIGYTPWPGLPQEALAEALGASAEEVLRLAVEGERLTAESIALAAFRPLSRAGVRLAVALSVQVRGGAS